MRIASIGVAIPSRKVDNEDVLALIAQQRSRDTMSRAIARSARNLMLAAGSDVRYYRAEGERAHDLVRRAMDAALDQAAISASEIDLLIFCGVGRGFIEPGNAYVCADQLGVRCECFDISDACMGWLRAAQVAHDAMRAGRYRRVLIVNAEFGIQEHLQSCFRVSSPLDLHRTFAAFTIGEAATATVLEASPDVWSFAFRSRPDLSGLCSFPLPGHEGFAAPGSLLSHAKPMHFYAYSTELFAAAETELSALIAEQVEDFEAPRLFIPHAASSTASAAAGQRIGLPLERMYTQVMPRYGNVVSASLPLGLYCAAHEGLLEAGDEVVLCPASAGLSVAVSRLHWQPLGAR